MKVFQEAYKSIFHYYSEHGSQENLFYVSNMYWIHFILNQSFMNILHGYKLVRSPSCADFISCPVILGPSKGLAGFSYICIFVSGNITIIHGTLNGGP